jgi:hypothetical protein
MSLHSDSGCVARSLCVSHPCAAGPCGGTSAARDVTQSCDVLAFQLAPCTAGHVSQRDGWGGRRPVRSQRIDTYVTARPLIVRYATHSRLCARPPAPAERFRVICNAVTTGAWPRIQYRNDSYRRGALAGMTFHGARTIRSRACRPRQSCSRSWFVGFSIPAPPTFGQRRWQPDLGGTMNVSPLAARPQRRGGRKRALMLGGRRSSFFPSMTRAKGMRVTSSRRSHPGQTGVSAPGYTISSKFFEQRLQTYSYSGMTILAQAGCKVGRIGPPFQRCLGQRPPSAAPPLAAAGSGVSKRSVFGRAGSSSALGTSVSAK